MTQGQTSTSTVMPAQQQGLQNWATPADFFQTLQKLFFFRIDVCATKDNAKLHSYITPEMDALGEVPWHRRAVAAGEMPRYFCNPGFADALPWHKRANAEVQTGGSGSICLILGLAGASQKWFEYAMDNATAMIHFAPRINYIDPTSNKRMANSRECVGYLYTHKNAPYLGLSGLCLWKWNEEPLPRVFNPNGSLTNPNPDATIITPMSSEELQLFSTTK